MTACFLGAGAVPSIAPAIATKTSWSLSPATTTALCLVGCALQNSASCTFAGTFITGADPTNDTTPCTPPVPGLYMVATSTAGAVAAAPRSISMVVGGAAPAPHAVERPTAVRTSGMRHMAPAYLPPRQRSKAPSKPLRGKSAGGGAHPG